MKEESNITVSPFLFLENHHRDSTHNMLSAIAKTMGASYRSGEEKKNHIIVSI